MDAVLQTLRAELSAIDGRRALLVEAIASLERLMPAAASSPSYVTVVDEAHRHEPGVPATPIILDELHDEAPKLDPVGLARIGRLLAAEKRAKAGLKDDEQRILEVLRRRGKLSLAAIVDDCGLARDAVRYRLYELQKRGLVGAAGAPRSRVFFSVGVKVPPRKNGEDLEPVWDGSTKRSPAEVLQARREAQS